MKKNQLFQTYVLFFLACPLLGGNFLGVNPNRAWTFCPLMRGVRYLEGFLQGICTIFFRSSNFCPLFGGIRCSECSLIKSSTVFKNPQSRIFTLTYLALFILILSTLQKQPLEVFYKKVFLEISQNSQKLLATLLKKRLWHMCLPVNFANFFCRTPPGDCFWLCFKNPWRKPLWHWSSCL